MFARFMFIVHTNVGVSCDNRFFFKENYLVVNTTGVVYGTSTISPAVYDIVQPIIIALDM